MLKIFVYYLTKISLLLLLSKTTTSKKLQRIFWFSMFILTLWTVAAIFAQALQCPPPQPWNILSLECRNLVCGNITTNWNTLPTPYTRTPSILRTTQSISSLTSLSCPSLSSFYGLFRLKGIRNWPSIQSLRYGFCRSSHGRKKRSADATL